MWNLFCNPSLSVEEDEDKKTPPVQDYIPPKVWSVPDPESLSSPSANRPTAGPRADQKLSQGKHGLQLYSMGTPNGQKVTILLEELLAAGIVEAEYDAWLVNIVQGDQFGSDFVHQINPNSKIPGLLDYRHTAQFRKSHPATRSNRRNKQQQLSPVQSEPTAVFESGSILLYLAEQFAGRHSFLPSTDNVQQKTKVLNWLFWQVGSAPLVGGGFGHFYVMAKGPKQAYPIDRFTMETKRQLDVLNRQLSHKAHKFICGSTYTLADMAIYPWYGQLVLGDLYNDQVPLFLNAAEEYPHVVEWAQRIRSRPAVQRGLLVNKFWGDGAKLPERHDAKDIDQVLAKPNGSKE